MPLPSQMVRAVPGEIRQHRNGYIFIKLENGEWQAHHRWVMEHDVEHRELKENERVYHKDGRRDNNEPENLVTISYSLTPFKVLEKTRVLFVPRATPQAKRTYSVA